MTHRVLAWINCHKRDAFNLEAHQGSGADRTAASYGKDVFDFVCQSASARV